VVVHESISDAQVTCVQGQITLIFNSILYGLQLRVANNKLIWQHLYASVMIKQ